MRVRVAASSGCLKVSPGLVEVAVALEDVAEAGKRVRFVALEGAGFVGGEDVAVGGEADGGGHVLGEGEFAEVLLRVGEAGDGAGDAGGFVADEGHAGDDVALGVEVHVAGGGGGGLFAVVEEVGLAVLWPRMSMKPPPPMFPAAG